jgi:hypothetical protein
MNKKSLPLALFALLALPKGIAFGGDMVVVDSPRALDTLLSPMQTAVVEVKDLSSANAVPCQFTKDLLSTFSQELPPATTLSRDELRSEQQSMLLIESSI